MPPSTSVAGATTGAQFLETDVYCVACKRSHTAVTLPDVPLTDYKCPQKRTPLFYDERFKPLRLLAKGPHTSILLARDLSHSQDEASTSSESSLCVLKVYTGRTTDAQVLFEAEVGALNVLRHPNVPALIASGTHADGNNFVAMEYADGEDMGRLLARTTAGFNEETVRKLLMDILPVLAYLHSKGFVHRDVKPENIVHRRGDGRFLLVDFGHSRGSAPGATFTTNVGTAAFAAPEQVQGKAGPASDLYSLGATCLNLLTKQAPSRTYFQNWTPRESVSGPLAAFVRRLLREAPEQRWANGAQALADFPFCDEDRIRLSKQPPPHSQRRIPRRSQTPSPPRGRAPARSGRLSAGPSRRRPVGARSRRAS
eukprot:tig00000882_g5274.t1